MRLGELILTRRDLMPHQVFYMIAKGKVVDADRLNLKSHTGSFSVIRFKGRTPNKTLQSRVGAVEKLHSKVDGYGGHGLCSSYVDYLYDRKIHHWWNQIPVLNRVTENLIPLLNIKTPSALATSPQIEKLCEVGVKNKAEVLMYPKQVSTKNWVAQLVSEAATGNAILRAHSDTILKDLQAAGVISRSGKGWKILYDSIQFQSR